MGQPAVLLKTPLTANTGYGNDGFSLARGFYEAGLDVRLLPTAVIPPVPPGVAQLMVKSLNAEFDYLIHHVDPDQLGLSAGEQRIPGKKIAWSMWEYLNYPDPEGDFAERLKGYDLFLAYDEVSRHAFEPFCEQAGVPIKILQGGIWADDWEYDLRKRDWTGTFRFGMVGQLHHRKNPFAAIKAFYEVHEEFPDTELHLKTTTQTLHPSIEDHNPGVKIHYELWPHERLHAFYQTIHCYVAPSWGEGKNLPALEAQLMGVPAIYSDFGGHRQWGSSETGWPVSGKLSDHQPGLTSMRVDHEALVAVMKEAVRDRAKTRQKGEKASRLIPAQSDWGSVIRRLLAIA